MSELAVLDLFAGQGGAALGYFRAGFRNVIGVDNDPKALKRYPFQQAIWPGDWTMGLHHFASIADLIHASPPCQFYSGATRKADKANHPDLIGPVRKALIETGKPYIIENVPGAPLENPVELCGCMFDIHGEYNGTDFGMYRPRLFESNLTILAPEHSAHDRPSLPAFGHGMPGWFYRKHGFGLPSWFRNQTAGFPWMTQAGGSEAIPPIFTEFIGLQARAAIVKTGWHDKPRLVTAA